MNWPPVFFLEKLLRGVAFVLNSAPRAVALGAPARPVNNL